MKKRITALLLCLVMAFSLIPTTVWANPGETRQVKMQILRVSEKYPLGYSYTSNESKTYEYTCQYANCGKNSYNHSLSQSVIKTAALEMADEFDVKFEGWTKTASANPQIFKFSSSGTTATQTTYTIYLVVKEAFTPPTPASSLLDNRIIVRDTTNPSLHVEQRFNVNATEWNNAVKSADGKTWTVTVNSSNYVPSFNAAYGVEHTLVNSADAKQTFTLTYANGSWTISPSAVVFNVQCTPQPVAPDAPSDGEINALENAVHVACETKPNIHGARDIQSLFSGWSREGDVYSVGDDYFYKVRISVEPYVDYFCKCQTNGVAYGDHSYNEASSNPIITLKYDKDNNKWIVSEQALVNCECEADLPVPTDDDIAKALEGKRFRIEDLLNSDDNHGMEYFSITEADRTDPTFFRPVTVEELQKEYVGLNYNSNPYKNEDGSILYFLTVADTADLDPYIAIYNDAEHTGVEHEYRYHTYTILKKATATSGWELSDVYVSRIGVLCDPVPNAPSIDDLKDLLKGLVNVDCSLLKEHDVKAYDTVMDTLKSSTLTVERGTDGSFFCNVELDPAKLDTYVEKYSSEFIAPAHEADVEDENTDLTVKLIWNAAEKKWAVDEGDIFTIITKCQLAPAAPDLTDLDGAVIVNCVGAGDHGSKTYALKEGTYTLDWVYDDGTPASQVRWDTTANTWRYDVLVCSEEFEGIDGFAPYVADFNKLTGVEHDRAPYSYDGIILLWEEGHWTDDQSTWIAGHWYVDEAAYVGLTCSPAAPNADMLKYLVSVEVSCKTKPAKHDTRSYDLTDGYFSAEVYEEDGVYFCRVTLNKTQAKYYVNPKFSKDEGINKTHKLKAITNDTVLLVWYEKPVISMLDGENGNNHNGRWVLADEETGKLTVTASCTSGGGNGGGGSTTTDETKTVKSGKTFDAGIAMYVGLGILSVTGSAVVIRKKKEF